MGARTGKHTILMKLAQGSAHNHRIGIFCGVVRDGVPCNEKHWIPDSTVGWFMHIFSKALHGNGEQYDDMAGEIEPDQVLTMQVDTDAGTLKF